MNFSDAEKLINSAIHPEDLFDKNYIEITYLEFAKIVHPDKNCNSRKSEEIFKKLGEFRVQALSKQRVGTFGQKILATIKTNKITYELQNKLAIGSIADIYLASDGKNSSIHKVIRNVKNADLIQNEKAIIHSIKGVSHIPKFIESYQMNQNGNKIPVLVYEYLPNFYTLEQVKQKYPNGVDLKTAAWIWNRMLGALKWIHQCDIIHANLTPDNFLICPETHDGILIGWSSSVKLGGTAKKFNNRFTGSYPLEILSKNPLTTSADIYMAAKCFWYIVEKDIPKQVSNIIRACFLGKNFRPNSVISLYYETKEIFEKLFGKPSFHPFTMD